MGNVISQNPSGNTNATAGSQVTITVGTAPATTTVPSVIGDPASRQRPARCTPRALR